MVPKAGLEPASPYGQQILSLSCMPFHHFGMGMCHLQPLHSHSVADYTVQHKTSQTVFCLIFWRVDTTRAAHD